MIKDFCENTRVGTVFELDGFHPVWFSLHSRKVLIKEIHYRWTERKAADMLYKFTVSDGETFYELQLSAREMKWHIVAMG